MDTTPRVTFFHAPQSRSAGTRALLEELGADYDLHVLDLKSGEQRRPDYLAINPMGKVPAIHHAGALVTEQPAIVDRSMQREPAPPSTSPYGDYDTMLQTLVDQLGKGPYLLGDTFSAADVLWGTALNWTTMFKLVPELPVIRAYIDRVLARPAMQRAAAKDAELLAAQAT